MCNHQMQFDFVKMRENVLISRKRNIILTDDDIMLVLSEYFTDRWEEFMDLMIAADDAKRSCVSR